MSHIERLETVSGRRFPSCDDRHVVVGGAVVGQRIAVLAESLRGIGVASQVDDNRLAVVVNNEVAHIIVVVALAIGTAFNSHKPGMGGPSGRGYHDLQVAEIAVFGLRLNGSGELIAVQHGEQEQFAAYGGEVASVLEKPRWLGEKLMPGTDIGGKSGLIYVYINGVLTGLYNFDKTANFENPATEIVINSNYCDVDLYNIRVYNTFLNYDRIT